ncbi:MAG: hypothetical protein E7624_00965 [Ruminococcaceae bacterium]|nr:hypothetical protein [Oscillospiraceae bacterium]
MLGTADFIKRLVKGEPSRAEKILGKIVQIKNALTGEKGAAANREIAFVQKAERLYLNAIAELGGTYQGGKIHLANREDDEKARTAAEGARFSAENSAESVDESGELRYNKRTTIDEKAGTDFLIRNFSGAVNVDYTKLYLSDQELAVISHSIKSGNGKLDKARKHGYVFSSNNFYSFVYNNDNSVTIANQYDIDTEKKLIEIERRAIEGDAGRRRKIRTAGAWIAFVRGGGTGDTSNTRDGLQSPGARRSSDPMDGSTRGSHNGGDLGRSSADRQNGQISGTFVGYYDDVAGGRRKVYDFGEGRFQVENARADTVEYYSSPEAAIEAENESLIKGYAKEFFLSPAEVKRKLEADPDLLSRAQDNGILFSRKAPTDGQVAKDHADA